MSEPSANERPTPYIPAATILPEITVKAIILGIVLSVLLAGANAYLGLLAGMTVSASIPAAVISFAVLRLFRNSNILENNIVQTAASAGESLAAGVIFTFPALIILGAWTQFNYWETTIIAAMGGLLGVLFTIPLRRALVVDSPLKFPEGVATAEVLKVGDTGGAGVKAIAAGGVIGALFKIGEGGFGLWTQAIEGARQVGSSIAYFGSNLLPALVAVGYIVGINIAVLVFLGGAINWFVAIPVYAASHEWPEAMSAGDWAWQIWSTQTRYIGVGAMVVGGLWALVRMWGSLMRGIRSSVNAYRDVNTNGADSIPRTERDTPMSLVGVLMVASIVPLFFVFNMVTDNPGVSAFMAVIMLVAAFLFSAVASYMAGLVGSSNNPISGVTIATLLLSALLLLLLLGGESAIGPSAAILIGAVVCCAAAIGGDNMQDLKAGNILGATPRKQQIMQAIGVLAAAFAMAPILQLLLTAYGIVEPANPGATPLAAPQATLMASVAEGVFERDLPWTMVMIGAAVAVAVIVLDLFLESAKAAFRTPVLAVAVGIYLPLELATPILVGGLISWLAVRMHARRIAAAADDEARSAATESRDRSQRNGLLFAAGLITGEALLGILLAIPIVIFKGENPLSMTGEGGIFAAPFAWPGLVLLAVVAAILFRIASRRSA